MAIDIGTETVTVVKKRRSWRIELFCELNQAYTIRVWRETVWIDEKSEVVIKQEPDTTPIEHQLADLLPTTPVAGTIAQQIAALADEWDQAAIEAES